MKALVITIFPLFLVLHGFSQSIDDYLIPADDLAGIFAEIKVAEQNEMIRNLRSENREVQLEAINSVLLAPDNYCPPVLFELVNALFLNNRKEEATFWFCVAQIRVRVDNKICKDRSVLTFVFYWEKLYEDQILEYASVELLRAKVTKAVDYVKGHSENYDQRWVNLLGAWCIEASIDPNKLTSSLSEPKELWLPIKITVADSYLSGFQSFFGLGQK